MKKLYEKINKGHFSLPEYLSYEAKDLLLNIMNVDPERRFNIEQIRNHSWFANKNYKLEKGVIIGGDRNKIDKDIISMCLQKLKEDKDLTEEILIKYLERNDCNHATAT